MTQAEFNSMLQTVQEIECGMGLKILTLTTHYESSGKLREAVWSNASGQRVFSQAWPFTPDVRYDVDMKHYGQIVYADYWR